MAKAGEVVAPWLTTMLGLLMVTIVYILGKLRDLVGRPRKQSKQGYAPIREAQEDFYQRRLYSRIQDLWNRPISSAPGAWVDVMDRTDLHHTRLTLTWPPTAQDKWKTLMHPFAPVVARSGMCAMEVFDTTKHALNLGSYNYLGFASSDEYCTPQVKTALAQYGTATCSPRVVAGTTPAHLELEQLVADFVGKEAAITFGMGYATNSTTIPALVGKGCLVLSDQLNHASIVAGVRASGAKIKVFRHNDDVHLEALLRDSLAMGQPRTHRPWKKVMIIIEGVYSMEGEVCALKKIVALKKQYGVFLYLDEAHSIGALGARGRGACEHWGVDPADVDIMMGTFTKSFGSCGGYVAASRPVIDFLLRHSPGHLYATSMSVPAVQQVISAMKLLLGQDGTTRGIDKVRRLHMNANYTRRRMVDMGFDVLGDWDSPVMPILMYHPGKMPAFSRICLDRGLALVMVGPPATPMLLARARLCISAAHTLQDLEYALEVLSEVGDWCCLKYSCHKHREPQPHPTCPHNVPPPGITDCVQFEAQIQGGKVHQGDTKRKQQNGKHGSSPAIKQMNGYHKH